MGTLHLEYWGYNRIRAAVESRNDLADFDIGRVITEHRERYLVGTTNGEVEAEITGNMRFTASGREDFPAVGDWVTLSSYEPGSAIIHEILPRYSILKRQAIGQYGEVQIIGTNIDAGFIMQSVDRDFNVNRLERYLTICHSAKVDPIIVLTKTDLIGEEELSELTSEIGKRLDTVPVFAISNETRSGYERLIGAMQRGATYCMLGSSGVGKSSLLNNLLGERVMKTGDISQSTRKGRHVSSHRELTVLENGSILIDNPGMREVGIADEETGLETTFDRILELSEQCRFSDCSHTSEAGCAVLDAVERGDLDGSYYQNYLKLEREKSHFAFSVQEKRKKDKEFGKMVKHIKQVKKNLE